MTLDLKGEGGAGLTAAVGVGVAGEDAGGGGGFERAAAPVVRGDGGAVGEGRSGAAESSAGSAAVEGDGTM